METTRKRDERERERGTKGKRTRCRIEKKEWRRFLRVVASFSGWFGTISKKNKTADYSSSLRMCACVPDPSFFLHPPQMVVILLCLIWTDFVLPLSSIF